MKRPNLLLITTDQQRADHLGLKGLSAIRTPHLDRLGTEGVHFDRAYCASPLCTPSRVSLLTGQWPSRHGAYSIGVTADPFPGPTIPQLLKDSGYATCLVGKAHFVRRDDEAPHFTGQAAPDPAMFRDYHGPYAGFETVYTCTGHTTNCEPDMHYRVFLEDSGLDYAAWFPHMQGKIDYARTGVWDIPAEVQNTAWVAAHAEEWIESRKEQDRPWFCWVSFEDPHPPFVCPEPWFSGVDADRMPVYEGFRPGEFEGKPAIYRAMYEGNTGAYTDGPLVPGVRGPNREQAKDRVALQAALGMIANIDAKVGGILERLAATGQLDDTVILFTSDHGEMNGHHGLWGKGLAAYDDCQKVPLLVWGPRFFPQKGTSEAIVSLVDAACTLLSLAGVDWPQGMQGADLMPLLRGDVEAVQDATIVECHATEKVYQLTLVTARYKLVVYRDDPDGELYDLTEDPDQYVNRWRDERFQSLRGQLLLQLAQKRMAAEGVVQPRRAFA